jgi:hypothetical protein
MARHFCDFFMSSMYAICRAHIILSELIILKISGEEYELWNSSYNFVQPLVISFHLAPDSHLSTMF